MILFTAVYLGLMAMSLSMVVKPVAFQDKNQAPSRAHSELRDLWCVASSAHLCYTLAHPPGTTHQESKITWVFLLP